MDGLKRLLEKIDESFFLFGPRGTGKTTWLRCNYADAVWLDFLDPDTFHLYQVRPHRLLETVRAYPPKTTFVIDEVQKVPEVLSAVHLLIEEEKGRQFILTGSSARKLKQKGVDLLAGRALLTYLHPFLAAELGSRFDLNFALEFGLLPLVAASRNPAARKKSYIGTYLKEEVLQEGLIRKAPPFSRFLEAVSFSQGSMIVPTTIARDVGVSRQTCESYIQILQDLLLSFHIQPFSKRAKRAVVAHAKFYYFDCGIFRAIRPKGPFDNPSEIDGLCLETLVAQHLRAWIDYSGQKDELFFWRTQSGIEVDFVIYGEKTFVAIEVKHSDRIREKDLAPLLQFHQDYPEAQLLFLYRGETRIKKGPVLCLPVSEFLKQLIPNEPFRLFNL